MEAKALETAKKNGTVVTEVSARERDRMREHVKPVTEKYTKELGDDLVREFHVEIAKVRGPVTAR